MHKEVICILLQSISNGGLVLSHSSHSLIHPMLLFLLYKGADAFNYQGDQVWPWQRGELHQGLVYTYVLPLCPHVVLIWVMQLTSLPLLSHGASPWNISLYSLNVLCMLSLLHTNHLSFSKVIWWKFRVRAKIQCTISKVYRVGLYVHESGYGIEVTTDTLSKPFLNLTHISEISSGWGKQFLFQVWSYFSIYPKK